MNNTTNFSNQYMENITGIKDNQQHQIAVQRVEQKHVRACKNCTKLHHKCDKRSPSCSHCLKRNVPCEINPSIKKRGRPFGTTKDKISQKRKESEVINSPMQVITSPKEVIKSPQDEIESHTFQSYYANANTSFQDSNKKIKLEENSIPEYMIPHKINTIRRISSAKTYSNNMDQNIMITPSQVPVDINWDYNLQFENNQSPSLFQNDHFYFSEANYDRNNFEMKTENLDYDHLNTFLVNPEDLFY